MRILILLIFIGCQVPVDPPGCQHDNGDMPVTIWDKPCYRCHVRPTEPEIQRKCLDCHTYKPYKTEDMRD